MEPHSGGGLNRSAQEPAGIPVYELVPGGATRSVPAPHVHSKSFDRSAALLRAFRAGVYDAENLVRASYPMTRDLVSAVLESNSSLLPSYVDGVDKLMRTNDQNVNGRHVVNLASIIRAIAA
jgi:hypothetical protein